MKKFRTVITIPAFPKNQKTFDFCEERGYTYLGLKWIEEKGFWIFECIEYRDEKGEWHRDEAGTKNN